MRSSEVSKTVTVGDLGPLAVASSVAYSTYYSAPERRDQLVGWAELPRS